MALLNILKYPDLRLRKKALPVKVIDAAIKKLAADMLETMYAAPGIGLAATQVNIQQRLVVMDLSDEKDNPRIFINPEIEVVGDNLAYTEEGCLSVPGFFELVTRPSQVIIHALDLDGNNQRIDAEELLAICIQHEIDHLDGKLFVDYLTPLKRNRIRQKLEKQQRQTL